MEAKAKSEGKADGSVCIEQTLAKTTLTIIKNGRLYECTIDAKFVEEHCPIRDKTIIDDVLTDVRENGTEYKMEIAEGGLKLGVTFEQNKRQKSFVLFLKDSEFELDQKIAKAEKDLKTTTGQTESLTERITAIISPTKSFKLIDLQTIKIGSGPVKDAVKQFLLDVFQLGDRWLEQNPYHLFIAWLAYMSYTLGYHYYCSWNVNKIENATIDGAVGIIVFYCDKKYWCDYNSTAPSTANELIRLPAHILPVRRTLKAKN